MCIDVIELLWHMFQKKAKKARSFAKFPKKNLAGSRRILNTT